MHTASGSVSPAETQGECYTTFELKACLGFDAKLLSDLCAGVNDAGHAMPLRGMVA
jgi:hypothetical protein